MRYFLFILFIPFLVWSELPSWMEAQIDQDFLYFKDKQISSSRLNALYEKEADHYVLIKYTIKDNKVLVDDQYVEAKGNKARIERYREALSCLCDTRGLPDVVLLISINDGLHAKEDIPIFAQCKKDSDRIILLPDYEALGTRFQVLKGVDITKKEFPWETKLSKLIWRGSTAQHFWKIQEKHLPLLSRVKLCELGESHPEMIDAKFTIFAQNGDKFPYLKHFEGSKVSFEEQMNYKYHILIDGNVSPYSNSGWKLFANSLLFKPHSKWVQWYFGDLIPYVHYVPVESDLSDLMEKMRWALENDAEAKQIANNCRAFALAHLTLPDQLLYLYHAILRYHELQFVP